MATVNASTSDELRSEIQLAASDTTIVLNGTSPYSVVTLAKFVCVTPAPFPASGYAIEGSDQTLLNTRIFQQNIDNPYSPGFVRGLLDNTDPFNPIARYLTLDYTSGGAVNGNALFHSTSGSYVFDYLHITGTHSGWNGNGQLYMSLSSFTPQLSSPRSNVDFTLSNSIIDIAGQSNFNYNSPMGGGSAFLHSFNNDGAVTVYNNNFDESNYLSSFNFFNQFQSLTTGSYDITKNTFYRSIPAAQTTRRRGSRLTNVTARLEDNTFKDGAYLDVFGTVGNIIFHEFANNFETIAGGYGIKGNYDSTYGGLAGTIKLDTDAVVSFTGPGLPLYYDSAVSGSLTLETEMMGGSINFDSMPGLAFNQASAGSRAGDAISPVGLNTTLWVRGDLGDDTITGSADYDYVDTGAGNDVVDALGGNDSVYGFEGLDTIYGGSGGDFIDGGIDNDQIDAGEDEDTVLGGTGDDAILGGNGSDSIDAGSGQDTIDGGTGNDTIFAGTGDDSILGGSDNDSIEGDAGNDTILGDGGMDMILGGDGDDSLEGGDLADTVHGGIGLDRIDGGSGTDILYGEDGADTIAGGLNSDFIYGGAGADSLTGGSDAVADLIDGGTENDTIAGEAGNDNLLGGDGDDSINGGAGLDTITGGIGADTMTGGFNNDRFVFSSGDGGATRSAINVTGLNINSISFNGAIDIITDFRTPNATGTTSGIDTLDVANAGSGINVIANATANVNNNNAWLKGSWNALTNTFTANASGTQVLVMYNGQNAAFNATANDIANYVLILNVGTGSPSTITSPATNWFV
jgi:Ca2+-binding RTX toxin-like protein